MTQITVDILIFAAIAVFLFFKLRNVLGEVDQSDKDKSKSSMKPTTSNTNQKSSTNARLAKLNPQTGPEEWPTILPDFKLVANATAHNGLLQVHTTAPQFDPYHFLQGAKRAFPMIIEAVSKGDKKALKPLLSSGLYSLYSKEIDARKAKGEVWESDIVDLNTAVISDTQIDGQAATITVDFEAIEKITARDSEGNFIDDQNGTSEKTQNQWIFSKNLKSNNHIWTLIEVISTGE